MGLTDAAYDAQHPSPNDADGLRQALARLGADDADPTRRPARWQTTIADVAADLAVIDLSVLVEAWARAVREDWVAVAAL